MNRRQFLIWSGALTGAGLAALSTQQSLRASLPRPKGAGIAPKGLFAPARGDVRLVVISDLNSQYGSTTYEPEVHQAIAWIPQWQPDLVLCSGDMVAAQSKKLSDAQVQAMWASFDQAIAAPLRRAKLPLGFTVGNHDGSGAIGANGQRTFERDRSLAAAYWSRHRPNLPFIDRAQFPFSYTFVQRNIFYLVWDASTAAMTAQQLAWVKKSLASPQAQQAKLRIVIGHLPLYGIAIGRDRPGEFLNQAETLRRLLEQYRVHTYISGHNHAYYPGHRGQLQLLYTGALGTGPRRLIAGDRPPQKTLTVVDISLTAADTVYTTYDLKTQQVIDQRQLPRVLRTSSGEVQRRDVQAASTT